MSLLTNPVQPSWERNGVVGTVLSFIPKAARRRAAVAVRKSGSKRRLARWLADAARPVKVHIACGGDKKIGWLNTDIGSEWYVDALERLPFPDNSIDYMYTQHFVEHITRPQACSFLAECRRVLRPTGALRISTPNLAYLVHTYCTASDDASDSFMRYLAAVELGKEKITPGEFLNASVRTHGHLHIWDFDDLAAALSEACFTRIQRVPYGESEDPELRHLETRYIEPQLVWAQPCDLVAEAR